MTRWIRRSLLLQMIGVYLVFALVVLGAGLAVNALVEHQLRDQVQASDLALAQETALETHDTLVSAERSVEELSRLDSVQAGDTVPMLEQFVLNPNKLLTHHMLLQRVWGPEYGDEAEYLRVYVGRLRRKLERDPAAPRLFLTEPATGYRFTPPA